MDSVSDDNYCIQIKVSDLKARYGHCAGALVLSSRLTEVIIFGGRDSNYRNLAATIVLRFGEYIILLCFTYSHVLIYIPLLK